MLRFSEREIKPTPVVSLFCALKGKKRDRVLAEKYEEKEERDDQGNINSMHVYLLKGKEVEIGLKEWIGLLALCYLSQGDAGEDVVVLLWALMEVGIWG